MINQHDAVGDQILFLTMVRSPGERSRARMLIESIRAFGGDLRHCPIWLYEADPERAPCQDLVEKGVEVLALSLPDTVKGYYFADKVFACAKAEEMAESGVQSLIWIDPTCLIIRPPVLYDLGRVFDAAVRPVHIKNVGILSTEPLDGFWKGVCDVVEVQDIKTTVETFVDMQRIRSYFNSHAFAINPFKGLMGQWFACFEALVRDEAYQRAFCGDDYHQVFLHQAVLSALLVTKLEAQRVRILPPDYNYPYNLQVAVPQKRRAAVLNDLVCIAYEDHSLDPDLVDDIEIKEPLRSWLRARAYPNR